MASVLKLAITGGIGSGKSVVAHMMSIMGIPVYDCDKRAKELMVSDPLIVRELKRMMGEECYMPDGSLNRKLLASRIFTDDDNIKRVNAIVHPAVKRDFQQWAERQDVDLVAVESAILYESVFVLFGPSSDWMMMFTHTGKDDLLSALVQMLISSRNIFTDRNKV